MHHMGKTETDTGIAAIAAQPSGSDIVMQGIKRPGGIADQKKEKGEARCIARPKQPAILLQWCGEYGVGQINAG